MSRVFPSSTGLVALALCLVAGPLAARGNGHRGSPARTLARTSPDAGTWPATKYASLGEAEALAELGRREIAFTKAEPARGVLAPVRLDGPVNGVSWHTELPPNERRTSPWEIFDARLVLALHDFDAVLREHAIDEVVIFSAWRPPSKKWPDGKLADRHPGAVAVDAKRFHKTTGAWIDVKDDFHGHVGATTCGDGATQPVPATDDARELRAIVCKAADEHTFHSILTPNYDARHFNHFHLEVRANVAWQLIRLAERAGRREGRRELRDVDHREATFSKASGGRPQTRSCRRFGPASSFREALHA